MSKIKLYCFPYAGGSAYIYRQWRRYLDERIELVPIELAGRGHRFNEPFFTSMDSLVEDVLKIIKRDINKDDVKYAFFGHSMGSLIAYELSVVINSGKLLNPDRIFLSGMHPPNIKKKKISNLTDNEFIKEIINFGATPEDIFKDVRLYNMFAPIIKADFKLLDSYECEQNQTKIDTNITVFTGNEDHYVKVEDVKKWCEFTKGQCDIFVYKGGHFFIKDAYFDIIKIINKKLII